MTAYEFLKLHNQTAEQVDAVSQTANFVAEMHKGLAAAGQVIPMIPTYLCNVDRSKIRPVKRILIDAGGTNFRSAVGYFDEQGLVHIEKLRKTFMPASDGVELSKQQFYDKMAQNIAYLADEAVDVGFCFSYPVNMGADMDGVLTSFSKEMKAPEVVGTRVGQETLAALQKFSPRPRKIVILNDTVATLLGGMATAQREYSTYLGYIYGTGTNVCCIVDSTQITKVQGLPDGQMLVNMECGGYNGFPMGDFDKAAIARTDAPNSQLFEKMTSGKYLANIIYEALCGAEQKGMFGQIVNIHPFELKDVSMFLENVGPSHGMFHCEADEAFAQEICRELIRRAAKLGAIVNSATAAATCTDKSRPVAIVAEGTTFNKLSGYRTHFQDYLAQFLSPQGIDFEIVQGEDLNLVGTLMSTMIL